MALDHYVSQVHLKNFYSPALKEMLYATRKSDLKSFYARSQDVCRIEENSTNAYLKKDRLIEDFLKAVEPRYSASLTKIRENKIDSECIHAIAGFAAFIITCSPAAMRLNSGPLKEMLNSTAKILDAKGEIPNSPEAVGEKPITKLLADGTVKFTVDPKYPQAIGISNILHHTSVFGNSPWDILVNYDAQSPFFTSDYPVAIEVQDLNTPMNRIVPLAPDLIIRIKPDIRLSGTKPDLKFSKFSFSRRSPKRQEVLAMNRLIVQCAEDLVLYRDDREWIAGFIQKNRYHRVELVTKTVQHGKGDLLFSTHRIRSREIEQNDVD